MRAWFIILVASAVLVTSAYAQSEVELSFPVTEESIVLPYEGQRSSQLTTAQAQLSATPDTPSARLYWAFDVEVPMQLGELSLIDLRIETYALYRQGTPQLRCATISSEYDITRMTGTHMPMALDDLPIRASTPPTYIIDANLLTRDPSNPARIRANILLFLEQPAPGEAEDTIVLHGRDLSLEEPERSRFAPWLIASYGYDAPVGRAVSHSWGSVKATFGGDVQ